MCNRTLKDSLSYLDHLNSRFRGSFLKVRIQLLIRLCFSCPFMRLHPVLFVLFISPLTGAFTSFRLAYPSATPIPPPSPLLPISCAVLCWPYSPHFTCTSLLPSPSRTAARSARFQRTTLAPFPADLAKLGQTTQVSRSTLSQVRARIHLLRESTKHRVTAKNYDFEARLREVREGERVGRDRRKEERKRKREERREDELAQFPGKRVKENGAGGGTNGVVERPLGEDENISTMMGFGGFGGGKKR